MGAFKNVLLYHALPPKPSLLWHKPGECRHKQRLPIQASGAHTASRATSTAALTTHSFAPFAMPLGASMPPDAISTETSPAGRAAITCARSIGPASAGA